MFAPKAVKPQTRAAASSTNSPARLRSELVVHRASNGTAGPLRRTIGDQATQRILSQRARNRIENAPRDRNEQQADAAGATTDQEAPRGVSWDFSEIPLFPPDHAYQPRGRSRLDAPPRSGIIQRKLAVGEANGLLEQEADRVADQVMRMPGPADGLLAVHEAPRTGLQRACATCEEEAARAGAPDGGLLDDRDQGIPVDAGQPLVSAPEEADNAEPLSPAVREQRPVILRKRAGASETGVVVAGAPLAGTSGATSEGRPLDAGTRSFFEQRFGHSFDHVRVHTDAHAAESTRAVNALAYTVGSAIVFAPGQYAPATATGRRLLAHELTHVLQQRGPSPARPGSPAVPNGTVEVRAQSPVAVQRWSANGPADTSTNTIVCDGSGGIRVQIGTGNSPTSLPCLRDCLTKHEESHRADALAANATVCKDKAAGSQVNFSSAEQKPSEIKASQVEIDCLDAKLPGASKDCKPMIEDRIKQMKAYRDSFK